MREEKRIIAPSFGVDAVAVVWHCVRAQKMEAVREVATLSLLLTFGFLDHGAALFLLYLSISMSAPRWWNRESKKRERAGKPVPEGIKKYLIICLLACNAIIAPIVYSVLLATLAGLDIGVIQRLVSTAPKIHLFLVWLVNSASSLTLVALPLVLILFSTGERGIRKIQANVIETAESLRPPVKYPPFPLAQTNVVKAIRRISEQQLKGHVMYGSDVFIGSGVEHSSWSFATNLRRRVKKGVIKDGVGDVKSKSPVSLRSGEVVDAVRKGMLQFRGSEMQTRDRLAQVVVTEYVFSPDGHIAYTKEPPASAVVDQADEKVRHFLGIRVGGWDEDLVTNTFVRVSSQGGVLYLEVVVRVLAPVRWRYRQPVAPVPQGEPSNVLLAASQALRRALPVDVCRWISTQLPIHFSYSVDKQEGLQHPAISLRQYVAASEYAHYFQRLDAERYVKTVERRIISSVQDLLDEKGINADEFSHAAQQVIDQSINISGGNVTGSIFSTGDNNTMHVD